MVESMYTEVLGRGGHKTRLLPDHVEEAKVGVEQSSHGFSWLPLHRMRMHAHYVAMFKL